MLVVEVVQPLNQVVVEELQDQEAEEQVQQVVLLTLEMVLMAHQILVVALVLLVKM
jgi:hypothetical protein